MKKVTVYTTDYCPYCVRAKQLLKQKGVPFTEVKMYQSDEAAWVDLYARSKMKTVPQIFLDDKCIGGFDDMAALDARGELDKLLGN